MDSTQPLARRARPAPAGPPLFLARDVFDAVLLAGHALEVSLPAGRWSAAGLRPFRGRCVIVVDPRPPRRRRRLLRDVRAIARVAADVLVWPVDLPALAARLRRGRPDRRAVAAELVGLALLLAGPAPAAACAAPGVPA